MDDDDILQEFSTFLDDGGLADSIVDIALPNAPFSHSFQFSSTAPLRNVIKVFVVASRMLATMQFPQESIGWQNVNHTSTRTEWIMHGHLRLVARKLTCNSNPETQRVCRNCHNRLSWRKRCERPQNLFT